MSNEKKILVKQIASPIGRKYDQLATLKGLGLNKINRHKVLPLNDSILGMISKVLHLVKYEII